MVLVDAGSILFDNEEISLLASSVNEDEQEITTTMTNTYNAKSTTKTIIKIILR